LAKTFVECNSQTLVEVICTAAKEDGPPLEELQTEVEETAMQEGTEAKGAISKLKVQVIEKLKTLQSSLVTALSRLTLNCEDDVKTDLTSLQRGGFGPSFSS
jgi:hypothetical protein